jgi:hypothetical protein
MGRHKKYFTIEEQRAAKHLASVNYYAKNKAHKTQHDLDRYHGRIRSKLTDEVLSNGNTILKVKFYKVGKHILTQDELDKIQYRDKLKNEYAIKNNIKLLRIPYQDLRNIDTILKQHIT